MIRPTWNQPVGLSRTFLNLSFMSLNWKLIENSKMTELSYLSTTFLSHKINASQPWFHVCHTYSKLSGPVQKHSTVVSSSLILNANLPSAQSTNFSQRAIVAPGEGHVWSGSRHGRRGPQMIADWRLSLKVWRLLLTWKHGKKQYTTTRKDGMHIETGKLK